MHRTRFHRVLACTVVCAGMLAGPVAAAAAAEPFPCAGDLLKVYQAEDGVTEAKQLAVAAAEARDKANAYKEPTRQTVSQAGGLRRVLMNDLKNEKAVEKLQGLDAKMMAEAAKTAKVAAGTAGEDAARAFLAVADDLHKLVEKAVESKKFTGDSLRDLLRLDKALGTAAKDLDAATKEERAKATDTVRKANAKATKGAPAKLGEARKELMDCLAK
ncbi:hypothetical protein ACIO3O_41825 [Streptomyces sp. NPDC087440]|uniref:hypothetical protein n=1 Tax=Streptomyces sp. NPDC087440 TaxID=3365790 RepID=UPI003809448D